MQRNSKAFVNELFFKESKKLLEEYFQKDMYLIEQWISNDVAGMGPFYLEYKHLPTSYKVVMECQMLTFVIILKNSKTEKEVDLITICEEILKSEYGNKWSDTELTSINIKRAIKELEQALRFNLNEIALKLS